MYEEPRLPCGDRGSSRIEGEKEKFYYCVPSGVRIGFQRRSDGNRRIETRDQRALRDMVQVGLAWPDGADDLVVLV